MNRPLILTKNDFADILDISDVFDSGAIRSLATAQEESLKVLTKIFHAESAIFLLRDLNTFLLSVNQTSVLNLSSDFVHQYLNYYSQIDPFLKRTPLLNARRDIDLMSRSRIRNLEIYRDFLEPHGIRQQLCFYLQDGSRYLGHIIIYRRAGTNTNFSRIDLFKARIIAKLIALSLRITQMNATLSNYEKLDKQVNNHSLLKLRFLEAELISAGSALGVSELPLPNTQSDPDRDLMPEQKNSNILTPRENEIAGYLIQGLTNNDICKKLYISLPTVATHLRHIYEKLGTNRRTLLHMALIR